MSGKFILLVEDNPDDMELTLRALKKNDILTDVEVVRDGVEALDFLFARGAYVNRNSRRNPQLILMDLKLPRMDGFEVLKEMRSHEQTCMIPVVVLTTSNEEQDVRRSYAMGANSYIRKPVDFDQFMEVIKQLERYWLTLNESPVGR